MTSKIKNILTAGAIGLASLLGTNAKAHDTIHIPNEYKIVLGPGMSTWRAVEYVLFGDVEGSKRPLLEQRKVSKAVVGSYETTMWDHELPEIDKHAYKTPEWKAHMKRIIKMRTDYTGFGDIEYLNWVKRDKRINKADGLAMDSLQPGDYFWMPGRLIENKGLARELDRKDGNEDGVIIADGTPVPASRPDRLCDSCHEVPNRPANTTPESPATTEDQTPTENQTPCPELVQLPTEKEAGNLFMKGTVGYLNEQMNGKQFMDGKKFDLDVKYSTGINSNWSLAVDNHNEYIDGTFYAGNGTAKVLNADASATFQYRLSKGDVKLSAGAGPKASVTNASINYDGNQATLNGFTIGPELAARVSSKYLEAKARYSYALGTEGDSEQGYNAMTRNKLNLETRLNLNPVHLNLEYQYTADKQNVRGVKRDNTDSKLEATAEYDLTENVGVVAGYEKNWHSGNANDTTANVYKAGVKLVW